MDFNDSETNLSKQAIQEGKKRGVKNNEITIIKKTDRQTDRQIEKQTDTQRHTDRRRNGQADRHRDKQ